MGKLDVDDSEIKSIIGNSINEVSCNFSPEWLSCAFMDKVIKEVQNLISKWNEAKNNANHYSDTNEQISNQKEPSVPRSSGGGSSSSSSGSFSGNGLVTNFGMNNLIVKTIQQGTKATIIETDNGSGYVKVRLEDGTEGYVSSQAIQIDSATSTTSTTLTATILATTNVYRIIPNMLYGVNTISPNTNATTEVISNNTEDNNVHLNNNGTGGVISFEKKSSKEVSDLIKKGFTDKEGEETL